MDYSFVTNDEKPKSEIEAKLVSAQIKMNPFDLDRAKQAFAVFESKIDEWAKVIAAADIKTEIDAKDFTNTIGEAKSLVKELENRRKEITGDAFKFYKDVMGFEKYYGEMIASKVIRPANSKLSFYFKQIQIERQKAERAAQAAAAKKQIELDKMADAAGVDKVKLDKPVFKDSKPKITGESASAHIKSTWLYRVENFDKIPRAYLTVDDKAVKRAIKNGERKIGGLVIFEETTAQVRSRR
jgi:hypothetical protein